MIKEFSLQKDGNVNITKHFKVKEFACKDGSDKILIDLDLVEILETARSYINEPIKIVSGYRTEAYNKKINGAKNSYHCKGQASDISVLVADLEQLAICVAVAGAKGIGIYSKDNFIHVDTRINFTYWKQ